MPIQRYVSVMLRLSTKLPTELTEHDIWLA